MNNHIPTRALQGRDWCYDQIWLWLYQLQSCRWDAPTNLNFFIFQFPFPSDVLSWQGSFSNYPLYIIISQEIYHHLSKSCYEWIWTGEISEDKFCFLFFFLHKNGQTEILPWHWNLDVVKCSVWSQGSDGPAFLYKRWNLMANPILGGFHWVELVFGP